MRTHNFLIATTRPELLEKQVSSFSNIAGDRRLKFYIFNDKDEISVDNDFSKVVNKLISKTPEITLRYFNIDAQIKLLTKISQAYASALGVSEDQILECFKENGAFKGIRSIQNKSITIFYYKNKDRGSIIHKLDDDIFPYEANRQGDEVKITIKKDFFFKKELSIDMNSSIFSGSNYTIDSPSPLVNYADFTEFLCNFYKIAKDKPPDELIGDDILEMSPAKVRKVSDPLRILDISPIDDSLTYGEVVEILEQHANTLLSGNSRIIINDNNENRNGINKFFPGGCVSFLYQNIPTLTPAFGNQDLLWQLIEVLGGKTLMADDYIGHIKSTGDRPSILDDLKDTSYKHQTSLTYSVYQYLISKHKDKEKLLGFQKNFTDLMSRWLEESKEYTEQILELIDNQKNWYSNESEYHSTAMIKNICLDFLKNYVEIKNNYSFTNQDVSGLMSKYFEDKKIFDSLLTNIVDSR